MDKFTLLIFALVIGGAIASLILSRITSIKWIWYIPSIAGAIVIGFLTFKLSFGEPEGFVGLGYIIMIFMVKAVMIGNIATNLIIKLNRRKTLKNNANIGEENEKEA